MSGTYVVVSSGDCLPSWLSVLIPPFRLERTEPRQGGEAARGLVGLVVVVVVVSGVAVDDEAPIRFGSWVCLLIRAKLISVAIPRLPGFVLIW